MSKYHAVRTGKYASKAEASRAAELALMEKIGLISDLREQVSFELLPKFGKERAIRYVADWTYVQDGQLVVEDKKGFRPPLYRLKRRMMLQLLGITITET
jgi:hypothetical protein